MATSGSIDFSLTAREIVVMALKKLGVFDPTADEVADGIEEMNVMLKGWQMMPQSPNLWRQTEGSVTLVASTASYTLSPKPFRVVDARYRNTSSQDLPMEELTREEYQSLPNKTSTGVPTCYYVDYQRASTVMYVWPLMAAVTTETIKYDYQRAYEDIDAPSNDVDIPSEYTDVVVYSLADRLQDQFGKSVPSVTRRAEFLVAAASAADRESVIRFIPQRR